MEKQRSSLQTLFKQTRSYINLEIPCRLLLLLLIIKTYRLILHLLLEGVVKASSEKLQGLCLCTGF